MAVKTSRATEAGQPVVNHELCTMCGLCTAICSTETLVARDGRVLVETDTAFGCIACGQCMAICPRDAVTVSGRCLSPADRLPLPTADQYATPEQLSALMLARRSCRSFTDRDVERAVVERVLAIASTAPMGIPPSDVSIAVFHGRQKVRDFSQDMIGAMEQAKPMLRMFASPLAGLLMGVETNEMFKTFLLPLINGLISEWKQGRDSLLYNAPLALLFYTTPYAGEADSMIAATYAMLAAETLGLGTCMIGSVAPLLQRSPRLLKKYGLPPKYKPVMVLVAGYPRYKFHSTLRRTFKDTRYI